MSSFYNYTEKEPLGFEGEDTFVLMQQPEVFKGREERVYDPITEQKERLRAKEEREKKELGIADPTKICLNRSEYSGVYVDGETGKRFRPGVPVEVGKVHAKRLMSLKNGKLFLPC